MTSRILLVDDSPTALLGLRRLMSTDARLKVVGEARTRDEAIALARDLRPDLVTMDVYLGGHDGVEVAQAILKSVQTRVAMVTGLDQSRAEIAFRALAVGALDVLSKPSLADDSTAEHRRKRFLSAIVALSQVQVVGRRPELPASAETSAWSGRRTAIMALGASTGGPPVLFEILSTLSKPFPVPIVIVQHIEASYTGAFAEWIACAGHPTTIVEGMTEPRPGQIYIAPGDAHIRLSPSGLLKAFRGEAVNFQIPSIDVLFESLTSRDTSRTFAALLSGMGSDGAESLAKLTQLGAATAVQSLESCVVPGIPSSALRLNDRIQQLTPKKIAAEAERFFQNLFHTKDAEGP